MTEKKKKILKRVGWGAFFTLVTCGAYLVAAGGIYGITRAMKGIQQYDDTTDRMRQTAADTDPKDGTPLFIGS